MARRSLFASTLLACLPRLAGRRAAQHPAADRAALVAAKITPDGPGLIAFFSLSISLIGEQISFRTERLLYNLGDPRFKAPESAVAAELIGLGLSALPVLRTHEHGPDPERSRRVEAMHPRNRTAAFRRVGYMPAAREVGSIETTRLEATKALLTFFALQ